MSNLLPILKNRQEFDGQKARGMFVDELFGSPASPILMYGNDNGNFMMYEASKGESEDKIIKEEAIKNLEKLDIPFHVQEIQDFKIVMAQHEYAAEKILDQNYMKKIAAALDTNAIVVGIPMKGFISAVAKGKGEGNLFGGIVRQYENAQTYPISKSLFYVLDGKIEMMGTDDDSPSNDATNELPKIAGINDAQGKIGFNVIVGHTSEDELVNQIQTAYQNIILHGMKDSKNFNGKIDFHIDQNINRLSTNVEEIIKKIAKNISERGAVQILGALSGQEFKVRFFYGDEKLIAETIETDPVQLTSNINNQTPSTAPKVNDTPTPTKTQNKPWWKFW